LRNDTVALRAAPVTAAVNEQLKSTFGEPAHTWDFDALSVRLYRQAEARGGGAHARAGTPPHAANWPLGR